MGVDAVKRNSRRNFLIIKEWNKGEKNQAEIGDMFMVSKETVAGILDRVRKQGDSVRGKGEENPERNSSVIEEWNRGQKNMSEIGDMFGISRCAVSGILSRARGNGLFVMAVDPSGRARRVHASMRKHAGADTYLAALRDRMAYANSFRVRGSAS